MGMGSLSWDILITDRAEADIDALIISLYARQGTFYAGRWHRELLLTIDSLAEFPGPRAFPLSEAESERRRMEVRRRVYGGPDRHPLSSVSCQIIFSVSDPSQGEQQGLVQILRILRAQGQEAADILSGSDN
jgi:plasmid stabilization system protein ParE